MRGAGLLPALTQRPRTARRLARALGGIAGGIALALLTGAAILLNIRLRERRERDLFASSLDTLPVARQIVAPDGSVFFSSTTYRRMFPDTPMPVKALLEAQMTGEPIEADRLAQLEAQAAAGIAGHTEITIRTPAGNVEWRDVSASPLQLLPGYVVWGVEDITPRRRSIDHPPRAGALRRPEWSMPRSDSIPSTSRVVSFINATLAAWLELSRRRSSPPAASTWISCWPRRCPRARRPTIPSART
jgi:hypothetical protein